MVHEIKNLAEFDATIANGVVVVDFFAQWCGPCKAISPKVEAFSQTYKGIKFIKVDVDDVPDVAQKCDIKAMPTFFLYKDGAKVDELVGANHNALEAKIKALA